MTQTQEKTAALSGPERAEQMLTGAGAHLGQWAGQAFVRLRQSARGWREEADQLDLPAPEHEGAHETTRPETHNLARAEVMVDQFAQRVGHWMLERNINVQRTVARLREDVEDMWVEAQDIQQEWEKKAGRVPGEAH